MCVRMIKHGLKMQSGTSIGAGNGHADKSLRLSLGAFHNHLKSLLEHARVQPGRRRQR
jgi:hypothetical protein